MVSGGFLVNVERVNIDELQQQYPEVFSRQYDKASGLKLERVLAVVNKSK